MTTGAWFSISMNVGPPESPLLSALFSIISGQFRLSPRSRAWFGLKSQKFLMVAIPIVPRASQLGTVLVLFGQNSHLKFTKLYAA